MNYVLAMVVMPKDCYIVKTSDFHCLDLSGRKVWRHRSKQHPYFLVWDSEKGEIEVFNSTTLNHEAVYFPNGDYKTSAVKGRKLKI